MIGSEIGKIADARRSTVDAYKAAKETLGVYTKTCEDAEKAYNSAYAEFLSAKCEDARIWEEWKNACYERIPLLKKQTDEVILLGRRREEILDIEVAMRNSNLSTGERENMQEKLNVKVMGQELHYQKLMYWNGVIEETTDKIKRLQEEGERADIRAEHLVNKRDISERVFRNAKREVERAGCIYFTTAMKVIQVEDIESTYLIRIGAFMPDERDESRQRRSVIKRERYDTKESEPAIKTEQYDAEESGSRGLAIKKEQDDAEESGPKGPAIEMEQDDAEESGPKGPAIEMEQDDADESGPAIKRRKRT
jgi:hypothetical protein